MLTKHKAGESVKINNDTLTFVHTLLKAAFKLAMRRRKITYNPMDGVDSPGGKRLEEEAKENREKRTMTSEQVLQFWAADQTRFKTLFTLAYNVGCRPGELLGLEWEYVDVASMTIRIRKIIKWRKGELKGEPEW